MHTLRPSLGPYHLLRPSGHFHFNDYHFFLFVMEIMETWER